MIKKVLLVVAVSVCIFANSFDVNDKIGNFSLPDQFDKIHMVNSEIKTIIVSFEKDTGKEVSDFLSSKEPDFLEKNSAVFIADISEMPSFVTKFFALPKMRDYKHKILLIYNENDGRFIHQDEKSTVYKLNKGVITSISYFSTAEELARIFN